ncbi:Rz1 family lipoprotein [Rahnella inusitata]|uniref:Rz1 family lipoprotein n=1 Tax=Rahnella inusitata TaxID=58169 RepID=UPI0039BE2842
MLRPILKSCMMMLLLAVSGCNSTQPARTPTNRPAPPAWMMAPAPDLLTPLNGIISPSEVESKPSTSN